MTHPFAPRGTRRFQWNLRVLVPLLRRTLLEPTILGDTPRSFEWGDLMDVCATWRRKNWTPDLPILKSRGLVHVTLCSHEGVRPFILKNKHYQRGIWTYRGKYTRSLSIAAFVFILQIEWCHTPNFEKLEGGLNSGL